MLGVSFTEIISTMLFGQTDSVLVSIQSLKMHALCAQKLKLLILKIDDTYSYRCALMI
jgi:hypothetical protein